MSKPDSQIHIIADLPIDSRYENTLYFEDREAQRAFFMGRVVKSITGLTYLRREWSIKVEATMDQARKWTYLYFTNPQDNNLFYYEPARNKDYYYFINKVEYKSDSTVELFLELDVIQTYMFDWDLMPCFIERTHTQTDKFGEHTIPEGLETGPLITHTSQEINLEDNVIMVLMACDVNGNNAYGKMYGGVYSGLSVSAVRPQDVSEFNEWLQHASSEGYIDAIVSMWMYPKELLTIEGEWNNGAIFHKVTSVQNTKYVTVEDPLKDATHIDKTLIRNMKTFTYPYTMLYVSNNMGGCAVYHRERFKTDGYGFFVLGALSPEAGVQLVPQAYKGQGFNYEEALSMPAFPTCAWSSDTYKVWLAQNQNQHELVMKQAVIQAGAGLVTTAGSALVGNVAGALGGLAMEYSALNQVKNLMALQADMAIQPDQARGNHSGNINLTHGRMGYTAHFMTVTAEYAKAIDDYFTRYGYKVNKLATPRLRNRQNYTYIKTVGCTVGGEIGNEDRLKIQSIFDKGVTFWANGNNIGAFGDNPTL